MLSAGIKIHKVRWWRDVNVPLVNIFALECLLKAKQCNVEFQFRSVNMFECLDQVWWISAKIVTVFSEYYPTNSWKCLKYDLVISSYQQNWLNRNFLPLVRPDKSSYNIQILYQLRYNFTFLSEIKMVNGDAWGY